MSLIQQTFNKTLADWHNGFRTTECIHWTINLSVKGYGQIVYDNRTHNVHRLMYALVYGDIPKGLHILHSCNNKTCYNPLHLRMGTHLENMRDKYLAGETKFDNEKVLEILARPAKDWTQILGCSKTPIQNLLSGRNM
jgi:hypothetical protein